MAVNYFIAPFLGRFVNPFNCSLKRENGRISLESGSFRKRQNDKITTVNRDDYKIERITTILFPYFERPFYYESCLARIRRL